MKKESKEEKSEKDKTSGEKSFFYAIIFLVFLVGIFLAWIFFSSASGKVDYKGVEFEKTNEGNLEFYKTTVEVLDKETLRIREFNFFLRNNPKELQNIPFTGKVVSEEFVVLNATNSFNCDGDGIIAIANLRQLYEVDGAKVFKNETAICDDKNDYLFINLVEGNETRVDQEGMCYTITINNCEIIAGTERLMLENLADWKN